MDVLTQDKTAEFIRKLQSFDSKKGVKHRNISVLEPRAFDIILQKLDCKKVLEIERVSDSCEQICKEYGIEYQGVYSHIYYRKSRLPETWDGDIIIGLVPMKNISTLIKSVMPLLQEGRRLIVFQRYNFVESWQRWFDLFQKNPFNKMYVTSGRMQVSPDGDFSDYDACKPSCNGAWYVWEKGNTSVPTIEWIPNELWDKYFMQDKLDGTLLKHGMFSRIYINPISVTIDKAPSKEKRKELEKGLTE